MQCIHHYCFIFIKIFIFCFVKTHWVYFSSTLSYVCGAEVEKICCRRFCKWFASLKPFSIQFAFTSSKCVQKILNSIENIREKTFCAIVSNPKLHWNRHHSTALSFFFALFPKPSLRTTKSMWNYLISVLYFQLEVVRSPNNHGSFNSPTFFWIA